MKKEFDIKPYSNDDIHRINSSVLINYSSIVFFALLLTVLLSLFIYCIYKSGDALTIIITIAIALGISAFLISIIKADLTMIKETNSFLETNKKYCNEGYVQSKRSVYKRLTLKSSISTFYVVIDDVEYQIANKTYLTIDKGDYVYYEVKTPLLTELKVTPSTSKT